MKSNKHPQLRKELEFKDLANDLIQVTQAKELHAEAAKRKRDSDMHKSGLTDQAKHYENTALLLIMQAS